MRYYLPLRQLEIKEKDGQNVLNGFPLWTRTSFISFQETDCNIFLTYSIAHFSNIFLNAGPRNKRKIILII